MFRNTFYPGLPQFQRNRLCCLLLSAIIDFQILSCIFIWSGRNMKPVHPNLALPSALTVGIPPQTSHILSFLFTTSYVGSLYVARLLLPSPKAKSSRSVGSASRPGVPPVSATEADGQAPFQSRARGPEVGSRDHPETIRLRMKAVGLATLACLAGVWCVVKDASGLRFFAAVCQSLVPLIRSDAENRSAQRWLCSVFQHLFLP